MSSAIVLLCCLLGVAVASPSGWGLGLGLGHAGVVGLGGLGLHGAGLGLASVGVAPAGIVAPGIGLAGLGVAGIAGVHDDGQWRPALDGSWLGNGHDGQWNPVHDNSLAGQPHAALLHRGRRSAAWINPNSLPVPLDEVHTAAAKTAQLIQQNTEGTRNILGGGIPLALPADTHEVAIGKQAHAIAHARQTAITTGHGIGVAPVAAAVAPVSSWAAPAASWAVPAASWAAPAAVGAWGVPAVRLAGVHGGVAPLGLNAIAAGIHGIGAHW